MTAMFRAILFFAIFACASGGIFPASVNAREIPIANLEEYVHWDEDIVEMFAKIPVQDDGRIKPLETVARFRLYRINARRSITFGIKEKGEGDEDYKVKKVKLSAVEWYLDCLFRQDIAKQIPFIMVDNVDVILDIGIQPHLSGNGSAVLRSRYTYAELTPALPDRADPEKIGKLAERRATYVAQQEADPKAFSKDLKKQQVLQLHDNVAVLNYLLHMNDFAKENAVAGSMSIGRISPRLGADDPGGTPTSEWLKKFHQIPGAAIADGYSPQDAEGLTRQLRGEILRLAGIAGGDPANPIAGISLFPPSDPEDDDWTSIGEEIVRAIDAGDSFRLVIDSIDTVADLPDSGRSVVVLALVGKEGEEKLHVRIFDEAGKRVLDKTEADLVDVSGGIPILKGFVASNPEVADLSPEQKQQVIERAIAASDYTYDIGIERVKIFEDLVKAMPKQEKFKKILEKFVDERIAAAKARGEYSKVPIELNYYKWHFLANAMPWFIFSFLFVALSWLVPANLVGRILGWLSVGTCVLALLYIVGAVVMRCIIMGRPPISTLYETILFIGASMVLLLQIMEYFDRRKIALANAAFLGAACIFLALLFEMKEAVDGKGDTMVTLPAVLRSNFWLGTHVIIINLGYASALLGSGLSIVYIVSRLFHGWRFDNETERGITRMVYGIVCFTLLFSLVGTVLGGVWANDSWGRFWGWDPKENGALMIVLWSLVILHARMGGYFKRVGLHAASVLLGMITVFSWWGVNLLDIGLHSYGRTSGVAEILTKVYIFGGVMIAAAAAVKLVEWSVRNARREDKEKLAALADSSGKGK